MSENLGTGCPGEQTWGYEVEVKSVNGHDLTDDNPEPTTNLLCDGDMEEYFLSSCWNQVDFGAITKPNGSTQEYTFDRLNTVLAPWPLSWSTWWSNGEAACGSGYHGVGKSTQIGPDAWSGMGKGAASAIEQEFSWAGGTLYWRISARGKFMRILPTTPPGKAVATIFGSAGTYTLLNESALTVDWNTFTGSVNLPAGQYRIRLDSWDKANFLVNTVDDGAVYYDDVYFSETPLSGAACEENTIDITPTPDVTVTATGTVTPNASETVMVTPTGMGYYTPTVQLSPTPTENPELLYIWNCGFEAGSANWGMNQVSSIVLAGGPSGPQAFRATGDWPSGWQSFNSKGAQTYLTAWVRGHPFIRAVNLETNQAITYYLESNYIWDWKKIYANAYIPAGRWRLELDDALPPSSEAFFDGVTLAYNGYATAAQSSCAIEPTPGPTPFVTATPTRTATSGNTSTPWPTGTPPAWWTPIPTGTPNPWQNTPTPNLAATNFYATATALGTPNPWQTTATANASATNAQGTATALGTPAPTSSGGGVVGTGTPSFQGTPEATPPYGGSGIGGSPGANGTAPCPKPDFWKDGFGAWIDGWTCEFKNFMSFGPQNTEQIKVVQKTMTVKEPLGTIYEVQDSITALRAQLDTYSWNTTGLPGTRDRSSNPFQPFINQAPNWLQGTAPLNLHGTVVYKTYCSTEISSYAGPKLGKGICFMFDILYQNNLMPILQFFIDASCIVGLYFYVRNNILKYF